MTGDGVQDLAAGGQPVASRLKADMRFTCAAWDEASGDLYVGSTHGLVIVTPKKTHHVKLQGETMQACRAGADGVWFAGPESLVRLEPGQPKTQKLARHDFGIAAGPATAVLPHEGHLWVGIRSGGLEPALYLLNVTARRVVSFSRGELVNGAPRGLEVFGAQVRVLTETRLVTPVFVREARDAQVSILTLSGEGAASLRAAAYDSPLMAEARKLVDAPFLRQDGEDLIGRDRSGLFVTRWPSGPVKEPWPTTLSLLGTCAARHHGTWLIGTPLGLLSWDGANIRQLGKVPVVTLVTAGPRVLVVGRSSIVALEGELADAPEFHTDLTPTLPLLASEAMRSGGGAARLAGLSVIERFVPGDAEATALVLEALDDPSNEMRMAAVDVVQRRHLVAGQDQLFAMMTHKHKPLRSRAIRALLAMGDPRAAANLVEALRELSAEEARGLIRDLTSAASGQTVDVLRPFVLDARPVVRRSALLWLGKLGFPQPLLGAIAQLERHQTEDREKGARNLAQLRDPLVVYLLAAHLSDPAPSVRREALLALAEVSAHLEVPEEAHGLVARALSREVEQSPKDAAICRAVVRLSEHVGGAVPQELVERALKNAAPEARQVAVQVVEVQRNRQLLPQLMACLHDPDVHVRGAAVDALGRMGDPRALSSLLDLLHDPHTFRHKLAGEAGNRAVTRAMARILGVDVPFDVEVGRHEIWAGWYLERILPLLERFGLARRPLPGQ